MSCSVMCIRLHSGVVFHNDVQSGLKKMPLHVLNTVIPRLTSDPANEFFD